jgi:hypothetical protein
MRGNLLLGKLRGKGGENNAGNKQSVVDIGREDECIRANAKGSVLWMMDVPWFVLVFEMMRDAMIYISYGKSYVAKGCVPVPVVKK